MTKCAVTTCTNAMFNTGKCRHFTLPACLLLFYISGSDYTARQCSPLRRKFIECSKINPALSLFLKHLVIDQRQKAHNFSAFHWSPHIGQHFITMRVVHLPKRTETSLITESDQSGPNHQLLQLCTGCTTWSSSLHGSHSRVQTGPGCAGRA